MEEQAKTGNKRRKRKVVVFSKEQLSHAKDFLISKYWTVKSGITSVTVGSNCLVVVFISSEKFRNTPNKINSIPVEKHSKEDQKIEEEV